MAIFPVRADSGDVKEYLDKYGVTYNGESLGKLQSSLLKDTTVIPLIFQNTCIVYSPALTELASYPSDGFIDFSFIIKNEL